MSNSRKKKILNHLSKVGMSMLSVSLLLGSSPALAINSADAAAQTVASEGGKEALNMALKIAKSKPALSVAAGITCIACIPVAGVAASPGLCIACGILIAKTLG
jgi:uncharacterized Tic20 family protein